MIFFIVLWQRGVDVYIVLSALFYIYISAEKKKRKLSQFTLENLMNSSPVNVPFPAKIFLCFVHGVMKLSLFCKLSRLRISAADR